MADDECVNDVLEPSSTPELDAFLTSPGYIIFAIIAVAAYTLVAGFCWPKVVRHIYKGKMQANSTQVAVVLAIGATFRAVYFIMQFLGSAWLRELLLGVAQISWVAAFTLVVMFWMEMQTTMRKIHSVHNYKCHLMVILSVYTVARIVQGVLRHICGDIPSIVPNIATAVVYVFYVSLFAFAAFWSWRLWRRLGRMNSSVRSKTQSDFLAKKLRKVSIVVILEVVFGTLLMAGGLLRAVLRRESPNMRFEDPSSYVLYGSPEYLMEYMLVLVLCAAIVMSKTDKRKASGTFERSSAESTGRGSRYSRRSLRTPAKEAQAKSIPLSALEETHSPRSADGTVTHDNVV